MGRSPGGEWESGAAGGGAGEGLLKVTVADSAVTLLLEGCSRPAGTPVALGLRVGP